MRRLLSLALLIGIGITCPLLAAQQGVKIFVSSGTGFLASRSGHIVTNMHVVEYCERITVHGAVTPRIASVIGRDAAHDLALLKIDGTGLEAAYFRDASLPVKKGERVVVVGYPGKSGALGQTVTNEALITNEKGPRGEDTWLQLSDTIVEGNSGGPLMDASGNVIGVIVARAVIYTYKTSAPENGTYTNSGVAIAAPVVKRFLDTYQVPYASSNANSEFSADRLTDHAHRFVVNVRCETQTEVR